MSFNQPHPLEIPILEEIQQATGLVFGQLGAINTRDKDVATAALPILARWIPLVPEPDSQQNVRGALFDRLGTPHATLYVPLLQELWIRETDPMNSGLLAQALVDAVKPEQGALLWAVAEHQSNKPFYSMLLAKLAEFPDIASAVKGVLASALEAGKIPSYELKCLTRVNDPRIRQWLISHADDPDPNVRRVCKRVASANAGRMNLRLEPNPPPRGETTFSLEVDESEYAEVLGKIAKELNLKIPKNVRGPSFLVQLPENQWVSVTVECGRGTMDLWFRLEDLDVVEIVIVSEEIVRGRDGGPLGALM